MGGVYSVKEIYFTLQGEGFHTGRSAVFLRFAGCNLWTGREDDRSTAVCRFCDTDFLGTDGPNGGRYGAAGLAAAVDREWRAHAPDTASRFVVVTGGEPLLQLDTPLIDAMHTDGFEIAIETNGTLPAPPGIDWVCVSPKAGVDLVQRSGDELKVVHPQIGLDPDRLLDLRFTHFFLQPMDGPERELNTTATTAYCRSHPPWRVSLQTHKRLGIP